MIIRVEKLINCNRQEIRKSAEVELEDHDPRADQIAESLMRSLEPRETRLPSEPREWFIRLDRGGLIPAGCHLADNREFFEGRTQPGDQIVHVQEIP